MSVNLFSFTLIMISLISLVFVFLTISKRNIIGKSSFIVMVLSIFFYTFGYAMQINNPNLEGQLFWLKFQYVGIATLPIALLFFALNYTYNKSLIKWWSVTLLSIVPLFIFGLVLTIERHQLYYQNISLHSETCLHTLLFEPGSFYWIFIMFQNACYLGSILVLLLYYFKKHCEKRAGLAIILVGIIIPLISHLVYIFGDTPLNLDITPLFLLFSSAVIFIGLFRFNAFDYLPIAKSRLFDLIPDTAIVLDMKKNLIGANRAAARVLEISDSDLGSNVATLMKRKAVNTKGDLNDSLVDIANLFEEISGISDTVLSVNSKEKVEPDSNQPSELGLFVVSIGDDPHAFWYKTDVTLLSEKAVNSLPQKVKLRRPWGMLIVLRDITEMKRTQLNLQRLATAIEQIGDTVVITDKNATIQYVNPAFEFITGYKREEAIGKNPRILKSGTHPKEFYQEMWELLSKGLPWSGHLVNKKKSGVLFTEDATITPVLDNKGSVTNYVAVKRDISDYLFLQQEVDRLFTAIEQVDDTIMIIDLEGNIQYVNTAFEKTTHYKSDEVSGNQLTNFKHDKNQPALFEEIANLLSKGITWKGTYSNQKKTGESYTVESTISPVYDSMGNVTGYVIIEKDVTQLIADRERLRESEEKYRAIAETTFIGILMSNRENLITYVNTAFANIFEYNKDSLIDKTLQKVIDDDNFYNYINDISTSTTPFGTDYEARVTTNTGKKLNVLISLSPLISSKGEMRGLIGIVMDVTERFKAIRSIQEAARIKSNFVSMVSHELKIPLTVIKEGINLISDGTAGAINDDQRELLRNVQNSISRLTRLINEVLDYQKLEAGKVFFKFEPDSINEVILETVDTMKSVVQKKGLNIETKLNESLPKILLDRDKIIQVLVNIIGNSVRFTNEGGIIVTSKHSLNRREIEVIVEDTGSGIKQELIPRLFEGFFNISSNETHTTGGTGLGLPISYQIIEAHNGSIQISSKENKGTVVTIKLPVNDYKDVDRE